MNNRQPATKKITALYQRLSRDDELQGESNSNKNCGNREKDRTVNLSLNFYNQFFFTFLLLLYLTYIKGWGADVCPGEKAGRIADGWSAR